jgi:hypothetical protein
MRPLNLSCIGTLVAAAALFAALGPALTGCTGGWDYSDVSEGNRCNPYDSHNECASGLACTVSSWQMAEQGMLANTGTTVPFLNSGAGPVLMFCPENYCCPVDSNGNLSASSNPNCQVGCNGGAAAVCTANGNGAPYAGVCDFADSGVVPTEGAEGGAPAPAEASTSTDGSGGG